MARYLTGIAAVALLSGSPTAGPQQVAAPDQGALVGQHWLDSLKVIAASRPCAATALLYVRDREESSGRLLLPGLPTEQSVAGLADGGDGRYGGRVGATALHSPESGAPLLVEVRWTLEHWDDGVFLLTTRAQLVDGRGVPLTPIHPVEPTTTVMISGVLLYLLQSPQTL
jgi:hypothetical protein